MLTSERMMVRIARSFGLHWKGVLGERVERLILVTKLDIPVFLLVGFVSLDVHFGER